MTIQEQLFVLQDASYAAFHSRLVPNVPRKTIIGVRVPALRRLAKALKNEPAAERFLQALPHTYYDENMLHAMLLCESKDYEACLAAVKGFLPYVDNWAVCDGLSPKVFAKHKAELIHEIYAFMASKDEYTCRFGINMLMRHFLDADFKAEYLEAAQAVRSEAYYVNMMLAWFFATALAKQWEATIPYVQERRLSEWVHNKTIQKACESYRITAEQKILLKALKG